MIESRYNKSENIKPNDPGVPRQTGGIRDYDRILPEKDEGEKEKANKFSRERRFPGRKEMRSYDF